MAKFISRYAFDLVEAVMQDGKPREAKWKELIDYIQGLENKVSEQETIIAELEYEARA